MNKRLVLHLITVLACVTFSASLAQAQATRTWVSGVGDDANPCSRTAPCKTFPGAISKTATNGEIDVLDPGAYSTVTITKSITIDGTGTFAGVLSPGSNAVIINLTNSLSADPLKTVRLRGISYNGSGTCGAGCNGRSGFNGILVSSANVNPPKLSVEDCTIDSFTLDGIFFSSNGGDLIVRNTVIRNNGDAGILLDSAGANIVHGTIENSNMSLNADGIRVEDNVRAGVKDSTMSSNTGNGVAAINVSSSNVIQVLHSMISENRQNGLVAGGNTTFSNIQIAESMIIHNNVGVAFSNANGHINSWGNNYLSLNGTDGTFTTSTVPFH
jgi:hypothetical protein